MQTLKLAATAAPSGNIMDRVKSIEDACRELGIQPCELSASGYFEDDFESIAAYAQLCIIAKALNEGWQPIWQDGSQYKYYPWFDMSSGSGLSSYGCDDRRSGSLVSSRLCFKSRELAEYAGKQFLDIYTKFFIIKKA